MGGSRLHIILLALVGLALGLSETAAAKVRPRENGRYDVTISGYYSGSGLAIVNSAGVLIRAELTDEDGNTYRFQTQRLSRDPVRHYRFSGDGTLGPMKVTVDGRVDPADDGKGEVLRKGRIVFTFKVSPNGKHGRGAGEKRSGGGKDPGTPGGD